MMGIARVLAS